MQAECYKAIKEILQRYFGTFVEKTTAASSLHDVSEKDWGLPKGLLGKDDPKKADQLAKAMRCLIHSHPMQAWTRILVLERLFDNKPGKEPWTMTRLCDLENEDSVMAHWPSLRTYYKHQNKALYDLILKRSQESAECSLDMLKTPSHDHTTTVVDKHGS